MPAKTPFDQMIDASDEAPSTELAPIGDDEVAIVATTKQYSNKPEFDNDDLSFPRLRLAQGLTPEVQNGDAKPGQWVMTGQDAQSKVQFVPLGYTKARILKSQGQGGNRETLCQSPDGITGYGTPGGACKVCPLANWRQNPDDPKKNLPPVCNLVYSYIGYSSTHDMLCSLDFTRMSEGAAKWLNTLIKARGIGNFSIELASAQQKNSKGIFYTPEIKYAQTDPSLLALARSAFGVQDEDGLNQ